MVVLQFCSFTLSSLCSSFYIILVQLFSDVEWFGGALYASVCHCRFVVLLFYVSDIKKAVEQLFLPRTYSIKQDKQNADCIISLLQRTGSGSWRFSSMTV